MLSTRNSNEHRIASLAVAPHSRIWRMVEIELAQLLFFPTWYSSQGSATVYRRALLSDWSDVKALLDELGSEALCRLQCLCPSRLGIDGPWGMCTIVKAWRAAVDGSDVTTMVFEDEEGNRFQDSIFTDEVLTLKEQVWPPVAPAP